MRVSRQPHHLQRRGTIHTRQDNKFPTIIPQVILNDEACVLAKIFKRHPSQNTNTPHEKRAPLPIPFQGHHRHT